MRIIAVTFRISDRDLDPEAISSAMGMDPTEAHRASDPIVVRATGRTTGQFTDGQWALESQLGEDVDVEAHIDHLLNRLGEGLTTLAGRGAAYRIDILIGVLIEGGTGGFRVSGHCLRRLAQHGIDLDIDLYSD